MSVLLKSESIVDRTKKATIILEEYPDIVVDRHDGTFAIDKYIIDSNLQSCTCMDAQYRGLETPCKHLIMVWLYKYEEIKQQATPFE